MCGDTTDVGGGGVGAGGVSSFRRNIRRREERAGQVKNGCVTISNGAYVSERSLSEVGTPPPHNPDTLHGPVASNTHRYEAFGIDCMNLVDLE